MLTKSCETLVGVGPILAAKLAQCGIHTIQDLLFHLPHSYQDRTRLTPICDVRPNDWVVIAGSLCKTEIKPGKKRVLDCYVHDKTGIIKLRFFHFNLNQVKAFSQNGLIHVFGEVREYKNQLEIIHPQYQLIKTLEDHQVEEYLTPIYPSTQGLSQARLRQVIKTALKESEHELRHLEWMNEAQLLAHRLLSLDSAIHLLHYPPPETSLTALEQGKHPAFRRLVLEELLAQGLNMQLARQSRAELQAPAIPIGLAWSNRFVSSLSFNLTKAQQRVAQEIRADLSKQKPMLRLLQGDVGSGKTVIAALAALEVIAAGYQVAFMVPTELLSSQHSQHLMHWLQPFNIRLLTLSAKLSRAERQKVLASLADNSGQLVIGTHSLFQEEVIFAKLGLVIIDEQHRFGVEQRLLLQQKGKEKWTPHQLLMTATPIPRTLAMTELAHLDLSVMDELPPGRTPIVTAVISQDKRELIIQRLREAIALGRQAYWVCTLIEESEKRQCMAAISTAENLQAQLPSVRVGLIHGRMRALEKEATMADFKTGKIDLLVATTVIEVGVDVPLASLMIIENSERLGLSQLHQLRGRVGRGSTVSHCLLLYQAPLSKQGKMRLNIMRETLDGFLIAEKDLELRGAGEILGIKQAGYKPFKIAKLERDKDILNLIPPIAKQLIQEKPEIARQITERWVAHSTHFLQG